MSPSATYFDKKVEFQVEEIPKKANQFVFQFRKQSLAKPHRWLSQTWVE